MMEFKKIVYLVILLVQLANLVWFVFLVQEIEKVQSMESVLVLMGLWTGMIVEVPIVELVK